MNEDHDMENEMENENDKTAENSAQPQDNDAEDSPSEEPRFGPITLLFEGVMVGRYNGTDTYEVGILPTTGHAFVIVYQEFIGNFLIGEWKRYFYDFSANSPRWNLQLVKQAPDAKLFYSQYQEGKPVRVNRAVMPDTVDKYDDFGWAITLEGEDCPNHPTPLPRKTGLLSPIIYIKNGELYNQAITPGKLKRKRKGQAAKPFGYMSQTVGVRFRGVTSRKELVLTRGAEEIFRAPMSPDENPQKEIKIYFLNTPTHQHPPYPNEPSHFQLFYTLFDVKADDRYDFYDDAPLNRSSFIAGPSDMADPSDRKRGVPYPYRCGIGNLPMSSPALD